MTKKITLAICFLLSAIIGHAQSYQWIKGGGSTEAMTPSRNYENTKNMCTDDDGNIYTTSIVGASSILADTFSLASTHNTFGSTPHILFASYSCDGTMRWAKLIECSDETLVGNDGSNNGLAYSNGSVYMVGAFYGYASKYIGYDTTIHNTYCESFTARFDTSGTFKWIRFVGPDSASTQLLTGAPGVIAVDGQGFIHNFNTILGPGVRLTPSIVSDTNGTYDLKYDSSGNLLSADRIHLDSVWFVLKVAFEKQNNKFYATIGPNDSYYFTYFPTQNSAVCAFHSDGSMIWMDTTGQNGGIISLDYKGGNEIYACGLGAFYDATSTFTLGGLATRDTVYPRHSVGLVYRLDTNGVARWVYNLQSNESEDRFLDISILPGGRIATTGVLFGTGIHGNDTLVSTPGEGLNAILLVVDSSGHTVKLDQFHGAGDDDQGSAITSDKVGNVYVGGMLNSNISATGLAPYTSHGGNTDFYLLKYGYDCACLVAPLAHFTDTGTIHRGFSYTGTTAGIDSVIWTYGDGHRDTGMHASHTFTAGTYTVCVTVYTSCGSNEYCQSITVGHVGVNAVAFADVAIYPNPATEQLIITNAGRGTIVRLFNIMGQQVYGNTITSDLQTIGTRTLPLGNYIIQLTDLNGNRTNRTIVKE